MREPLLANASGVARSAEHPCSKVYTCCRNLGPAEGTGNVESRAGLIFAEPGAQQRNPVEAHGRALRGARWPT
jgi:hypothetical protein